MSLQITPVESSFVKGYKYDPNVGELFVEVKTTAEIVGRTVEEHQRRVYLYHDVTEADVKAVFDGPESIGSRYNRLLRANMKHSPRKLEEIELLMFDWSTATRRVIQYAAQIQGLGYAVEVGAMGLLQFISVAGSMLNVDIQGVLNDVAGLVLKGQATILEAVVPHVKE